MTTVTRETTKGEQTRQLILDSAAEIASSEGLEGLTIGRLATELGMSKSGLFAHFGSKEDLQLATVARARERFVEAVFRPAMKAPRGVARLRALCDTWLDYAMQKIFPGGCFFAAAATEYDTRPGPVRDAIADAWREWLLALEITISKAKELGELSDDVDPRRFAYELNAIVTSTNTYSQLLGDESVWDDARMTVRERLSSLAAAPAVP